jgi:myo-inositol 2-dehydrogenase / D-chiro-inositol 1-dehydrogenase
MLCKGQIAKCVAMNGLSQRNIFTFANISYHRIIIDKRNTKSVSCVQMKKTIGVALIGAGRMGLTHAQTLGNIAAAKAIVVADANLEAAKNGQHLARAQSASEDIEAAMNHPDVEAVMIVTPTNTHASLIQMAAKAGKAIWCEKPIALTIEETKATLEVVQQAGVACQIGFQRRFDPGYVAAKRLIEDGKLGKLETFRSLGRDTYLPNPDHIRPGGGTFLDMTVHDFDLARFLIGEVVEISAWGAVLAHEMFEKAEDCDTAVCMLRFENGVLGVVESARHSNWGYDIRTEVAGSEGKVVVEAPHKTPIQHFTGFQNHTDVYINFPDRFADAYRLQMEAFFDSLLSGSTPSPSPKDALETLRICLAAKQSWQQGKPIKIQDVQ